MYLELPEKNEKHILSNGDFVLCLDEEQEYEGITPDSTLKTLFSDHILDKEKFNVWKLDVYNIVSLSIEHGKMCIVLLTLIR